MQWQREGCSGLWRSEDMVRIDLIVQREVLHDTMLEIGMLGNAQFIDMNEGATAFARPFTAAIRRCEDMERKLRYIEEELKKDASLVNEYIRDFDYSASVEEMRAAMLQGQIDTIDERIENTASNLAAMVSSLCGFRDEMRAKNEMLLLHERLRHIMSIRGGGSSSADFESGGCALSSLGRLSTLLGIIDSSKCEALFRLCYRVTRGNAIVEINNEDDWALEYSAKDDTGNDSRLGSSVGVATQRQISTFVIFSSSVSMIARLQKLVAGMGATVHTLADVQARGEELLSNGGPTGRGSAMEPNSFGSPTNCGFISSGDTQDLQATMNAVRQRKRELLLNWYREHRMYKAFLKVEKAVLAGMNLCAFSGSTCTASAWIPHKHQESIRRALDEAMATSGGDVQSIMTHHSSQRHPPTFFDTNVFTAAFQGIVDSYGIARYKEVNPGVFTIVTFPYLFGIMYGDIGHGVLLLIGTLFFIYKERQWQTHQLNEIIGMIFGGRYILLLMSLFAIYMGMLYNDFFGFSVNMFASGYTWPSLHAEKSLVSDSTLSGSKSSSSSSSGTIVITTTMAPESTLVYPIKPNGLPSVVPTRVYPFGIDVAWAETENKLEFYNSIKMKCAVIVGVVQMFTGLALSLNNHIYTRNWLKVGLLFVPEFIFLLNTFGYMSILIIVKWCTRWENTHDAPSLLEVMTNFFLQPGTVPQPPLFKGQAGLQIALLIIAFLMVPIMLCGMPIVEYRKYCKWKEQRSRAFFDIDGRNESDHSIFDSGHSSRDFRHTAAAGRASSTVVVDTPADNNDELLSNDDISARDFFSGADDIIVSDPRQEAEDEEFENFDLTEMIIHYVIHTIEYVLSCVSNTASYLRLWALSLAHAQLSEVFFTFAVVNMLNVDTTGFVIGCGVAAWLCATFCVLIGMEALSAFLHTLRLHWVEFQNKFYIGDGKPFEPLHLMSLNHIS